MRAGHPIEDLRVQHEARKPTTTSLLLEKRMSAELSTKREELRHPSGVVQNVRASIHERMWPPGCRPFAASR